MSASPPVILGVDPGARTIGVSVVKGDELVYYAVRTIKKTERAETVEKLRQLIGSLVAEYKIEIAAIEKIVFPQQRQSFVKIAYEEIKDVFKEENVPLFEYNPKLICQTICRLEKPTKRNAASRLAERYPELARYCDAPRVWQRNHFAPLFDAVSVALLYAMEIRETKAFSPDRAPNKN